MYSRTDATAPKAAIARKIVPQLVQRVSKRPGRGAYTTYDRAERAVASSVFVRDTGCRAQLSQDRNIAHGLDFNSLRSYNDATQASDEPFPRRMHRMG